MTSTATALSPYVGPQPFAQKDARLFFGRAAELRMLLSYVVASRVVLLYAPSGAGKTSLLSAGVLPLLEREEQFEVLPPTRVRGFASDEVPPAELGNVYVYNALLNWTGDRATRREPLLALGGDRKPTERPDDGKELISTETTLAAYLGRRERMRDRRDRALPRAIVFDQFEELFTAYPELWEQRAGFFGQVGEALAADPLLRVVLSLREDYLAELLAYVDARPALMPEPTRFRLERLGRTAALEAITKPLEGTGRAFAPGVAERLVDDLLTSRVDSEIAMRRPFRGKFVEPMHLQLACQSLWREGATLISERELERFGDVDQVLSAFYSEAVRRAADAGGLDEGYVRIWIEQSFITEMETRSAVYRTRDTTAGIANPVIDALEDIGLIRRDPRAGADWYELTHDRFIKPIRASNREEQARSSGWSQQVEAARAADLALARASEADMRGLYDDARTAAEEALTLYQQEGDDSGALNALVQLADFAQAEGRDDEALAYLSQARTLAERTNDMWGAGAVARAAGYSLYAMGRTQEAIDAERRAVENFRAVGNTVSALYALLELGQLEHFAGNERAAREAMSTAREQSAGIDDAHQRVAFLRSVGEASRMIGYAAGANATREAADVYAELGMIQDAVEVLLELAEVQHGDEAYAEAIRTCSHAVELAPGNPAPWLRRATAHWYDAQYSEAVSDFSHALELDADRGVALNGRGQALAEWGQHERAIADLREAIDRADSLTAAFARNGLGLALGALGRGDEALEAFSASLAVEPENAWAYFNRAVTHERMGNWRKAKSDYRRALKKHRPQLNRWRREKARERLEAPH